MEHEKVQAVKLDGEARQGHQIRLHEDEWEVVKMFANLVKQDINKGRETLKKLEEELGKV